MLPAPQSAKAAVTSTAIFKIVSASPNVPESCDIASTHTPVLTAITLSVPNVVVNTSRANTSQPVEADSSILTNITHSSSQAHIAPVVYTISIAFTSQKPAASKSISKPCSSGQVAVCSTQASPTTWYV